MQYIKAGNDYKNQVSLFGAEGYASIVTVVP